MEHPHYKAIIGGYIAASMLAALILGFIIFLFIIPTKVGVFLVTIVILGLSRFWIMLVRDEIKHYFLQEEHLES